MRITGRVIGVILVVALVVPLLACTLEPEPAYAPDIAEGILRAMNDGDYAAYSGNFTEIMKNTATESVFRQVNEIILGKIGSYVSKEYWKVEEEGPYTIVYYKARFTLEPKDVEVKVVF